eukprot:264258_1
MKTWFVLIYIHTIISIGNSDLSMPLREAADKANIFIGSSGNYNILQQDIEYANTLGQQYSLITAENGCKMTPTEPEYNIFNFTQCDYVYNFAQKWNQTFRGHNLCWNQPHTNPKWLVDGNFTQNQLIQILKNHITTVMQHYINDNKSGVYGWDIVNEAVNDNPTENGLYKTGVWYPAIPNYVNLAFQTARKANPNTKLFYNDYMIFSMSGQFAEKSNAVYNMIKQMINNNIPIDGIGFQSHMNIGSFYPLDYNGILSNFKRYADLG